MRVVRRKLAGLFATAGAVGLAAALVWGCAVHGGPAPAEAVDAGPEAEAELGQNEPPPDAGFVPFDPDAASPYTVTDAGCPAAMPYAFSACEVDAANPFVTSVCRYVHRGGCSACTCEPNLQGDFWRCRRCATP
jgi:hypothetical protein